ncbi:myb-like protein X isoform X2 [Macrobrachium nipponense]|uniref:myb-like protein X isoform X2 n=1 Tax=Macrobrachium nipponense TaxID=159736 RepID=UPI0030C8D308
MERRESTIFYSDDEGNEAENKKPEARGSKLLDSDLEKYTTVAVRAKISVEVEQRKRLGAWGKRVLVLDGTTLYAYKTKGDGGSVGGWAVAGADVHVRRSSDSNREDGRHILVIARPPVYKLVFAFSTVYEQARMIQALSSSGATVTGLDAIMLLKNLRQQQEQEQKEQEERNRAQSAQTSAEQDDEEHTSEEHGLGGLNNGEPPLEEKENEKPEDLQEIDESIYDQGTGTVTNPLYVSTEDLKKEKRNHLDDVSSAISPSINTYTGSDSGASHFPGASPDKDSEDKVNPVPKPPRVSVSEGSPISSSSVPDRAGNERSVCKTEEEASLQQSDFTSDRVQQYLSRDVIPKLVVTEGSIEHDDCSSQYNNKDNLSENTFSETPSSSHSSSDEDTEGEGFYEVNPDPQEGLDLQETIANPEDSSVQSQDFDNNYVELVSKMKLERGLSIESNSGGSIIEAESPERMRKLLGDSPLSDDSTKSPSPDNGPCDKETSNVLCSDRGYIGKQYKGDSKISAVSDDIVSDNDERFEQLYQELSRNGNNETQNNVQTNDNMINDTPNTIQSQNVSADDEDSREIDKKNHPNGSAEAANTEENKEEIIQEKIIHEAAKIEDEEENYGSANLKRVSSIIKKKGAPSTGKSKKVQFNLDATTIEHKAFDPPASSESITKKKSDDGPTSPAKKRGIFSNIFSSPSKKSDAAPPKEEAINKKNLPSKKEDISKKDLPLTKVDAINKELSSKVESGNKKDPPSPKLDKNGSVKKTPPASHGNLKRQPTVDLTAPLIISGSVEMGGSISGKVSPRRIEVRDGHVLAFMPKANSPTSRLSLVGLSVTPLVGGVHPNALSLARANRCMMVIKLSTREEMMRWINVLSDEVIKLTPENQRRGLILYPSPQKDVSKDQSAGTSENSKESHEKENTAITHNFANGHEEAQAEKVNAKNIDLKKHNQPDDEEAVNGNKSTGEIDEDTGDGWFKKKRQNVVEEFEMNELEKNEQPRNPSIKSNHQLPVLDSLKAEHSQEEKDSEKTRKINKLNIQEIWREHKDTTNEKEMINSPNRRQSLENRQHPPLRRLSGQDHFIKTKPNGNDVVGNHPSVNNPAKRDYHANCHPPLERLSNRCRVLSASESNLRKSSELKSYHTQNLQRSGSELVLIEKPKEANINLDTGTSDATNVLVSSRIIRNQSYINKSFYQKGPSSGMSPAGSPSHNRSKKSVSYEPREVEIIESKKTGSQELQKVDVVQWYEDNKTKQQDLEPSQEDLPGITWSVAATREKFELLCSVSGENKSGKLTTKTPISRKKSIKKRRSIEGAPGRRSNARWSTRSSSQEANDLSNSSTTLPAHMQANSVSDRTTGNTNTSSSNNAYGFKLPPVRDLRRNFEKDVTDSSDSFLTNSSSLDSINNVSTFNDTNNDATTQEPSSPLKSPLRRTQNILYTANSPCSSPEPEFITSKLINSRPRSNIQEEDKGVVSRALINQVNPERDSEVVICWRGPYIAQEAEQAVLSNISNAFLAKRRLLSREVATARIQEKLSALEETIWDIQASLAELDKQTSSMNAKPTNKWKTLERSLHAAEEDMAYWTSRLAQTQKEAEQAREKLAAALVTGLSQYNSGETIKPKHRQQLLKKFTKGSFKNDPQEEEEDEVADEENHLDKEEESFA